MIPHMDQLSAWVQAVIRSTVPSVVALALSWLVARGLIGPDVAEELGPETTLVVVALAIALWNTLARWLEPRVPSWITTLMGLAGRPPSYVDTTATELEVALDRPTPVAVVYRAPDGIDPAELGRAVAELVDRAKRTGRVPDIT